MQGDIFGNRLVGGMIAVQAFYMISGFYMALVLNEKYVGKKSYGIFLSNRIIRLYPVHLFVLILFCIIIIASHILVSPNDKVINYAKLLHGDTFDIIMLFILFVVNILLIGQDWTKFIGIDFEKNAVTLTDKWSIFSPSTSDFMINPPAWTIGLELTFYIIAPFIVRKSLVTIIFLIILSLLLRLGLYKMGLFHDPFSYRFFPSELTFFLAGGILYKLYLYLKEKKIPHQIGNILLIGMLGLIFSFEYIQVDLSIKTICFYLYFAFSMVFIFLSTKQNTKDRNIGELSYPIYISHMLVLFVVPDLTYLGKNLATIINLISIISFAFILYLIVIKRVEMLRIKRPVSLIS